MSEDRPARVSSRLLAAQPRVEHGFFGRAGGVSTGVWASLNTGEGVGDDEGHVAVNRQRVAHRFNLEPTRLRLVRQVHGRRVLRVSALTSVANIEADALLCTEPDLLLGIKTADCLPMLVVAGERAVAAVHGGWRGLAAGICEATVEALRSLGAQTQNLHVAIGPHIGPCCYAVGEEVIRALGEVVRVTRDAGRVYADLAVAARVRWAAAGVPSAQIDVVGGCVACQPEHYFSHRRDRGHTGRNLSVIVRRSGDT